MRLRRLAALVTSAALLHLSVGRTDAACAPRGAPGHDAPSAAAAVHVMPMGPHAMPAASDAGGSRAEAASCEAPAHQPGCCIVMGGCGDASAPSGVSYRLLSPTLLRARIDDARHDAPASFAAAPEPPPPKA